MRPARRCVVVSFWGVPAVALMGFAPSVPSSGLKEFEEERTFGLMDEGGAYHAYARELVQAGVAVLVPMHLRSVERRNRIERLCRLADLSLPGSELGRAQRLLDEGLADPRIDGRRVGMWGLSRGGLATMFWTPLEPRVKVAVVAGWFNHRRNKMVIPDKRYSCFLGKWLREQPIP